MIRFEPWLCKLYKSTKFGYTSQEQSAWLNPVENFNFFKLLIPVILLINRMNR